MGRLAPNGSGKRRNEGGKRSRSVRTEQVTTLADASTDAVARPTAAPFWLCNAELHAHNTQSRGFRHRRQLRHVSPTRGRNCKAPGGQLHKFAGKCMSVSAPNRARAEGRCPGSKSSVWFACLRGPAPTLPSKRHRTFGSQTPAPRQARPSYIVLKTGYNHSNARRRRADGLHGATRRATQAAIAGLIRKPRHCPARVLLHRAPRGVDRVPRATELLCSDVGRFSGPAVAAVGVERVTGVGV